MTKTVKVQAVGIGLTATVRDNILAAADSWHDPANGHVANSAKYLWGTLPAGVAP